jgi:hypothetical protein
LRRCPSCKQTYSDKEVFCSNDGASLAELVATSIRDETIKGKHLSIVLDNPAGYYLPGDVIHGTVTLATEKEIKINSIKADLACLRSYKILKYRDRHGSDKDYSTHESTHNVEEVAQGNIFAEKGKVPARTVSSYDFDFIIPCEATPTCAAELVKVRWVIKVIVDIPWAVDQQQELELLVVSTPPGKQTEPGIFGEMNDPEDKGASALMSPLGISRQRRGNEFGLEMRLRLPKLEFVAGETFAGSLLLDLREELESKGIKVGLVRSECTYDGDVERHFTKSEQVISLAPAATLGGGGPTLEYPFSLTIPAAGCVTQEDSHGYVKWEVVGTFDRTGLLKEDYKVSQVLGVYRTRGCDHKVV